MCMQTPRCSQKKDPARWGRMAAMHFMHRHSYDSVWLWCDLETTHTDTADPGFGILEIAAVVTDHFLNPVDQLHIVVHQDDSILSGCSAWCQKRFAPIEGGGNGLLQMCRSSSIGEADAGQALLQFINKHAAVRSEDGQQLYRVMLAGCGVGFDKSVLLHRFPYLENSIGHKMVDMTAIVEVVRRWRRDLVLPKPMAVHRAMSDVQDAIALCRWFHHVAL